MTGSRSPRRVVCIATAGTPETVGDIKNNITMYGVNGRFTFCGILLYNNNNNNIRL